MMMVNLIRHRLVGWRPRQSSFQRHQRGIAAGGGCVSGGFGSGDDGSSPITTTLRSSRAAPSLNNASSYHCLAWGAVASATAMSLLNRSDHRESSNSNNDCAAARGYHSTAHCESNTSHSDPSNAKGNDKNDGAASKSDSFFDMAQQWASEHALSKGSSANREDPGSVEDSNTKVNGIKTPEDLLKAIGIFGGRANNGGGVKGEGGEVQRKRHGSDIDGDSGDLKGVVHNVLFKLDQMQSSFYRSGDETNHDANDPMPAQDKPDDNPGSLFSDFISFANSASLFTKKTSDPPPGIDQLIRQAQSIANNTSQSSSINGSDSSGIHSQESSLLSQISYFQKNAQALQRAFATTFGPHFSNIDIDDLFGSLPFAAMHYYLEYQDSIKTPSWKRRMHRFQRDVEVQTVEELNAALILSELSYADSVEDIRNGLQRVHSSERGAKKQHKPDWELLFCDTNSRPNQPSHYFAIQKNASPLDDTLHVLMVVRGTKTMSDLITDAMMDATDYEYRIPNSNEIIRGKAHGGMLESGKYLVERHQKLLRTLLKLAKKRKLDITLIGHSLGAGAATIAAMEWNSKPFDPESNDTDEDRVEVSAQVIGFGCPAILSRPLSLATKRYVTTVIADADFIPRMSSATLVNLLLDVRSFDYRQQAERDVEQALRELQGRFAGSDYPPATTSKSKLALNFQIDDDDIQTVMGFVRRGLEKVGRPHSSSWADEDRKNVGGVKKDDDQAIIGKVQPVLFPPGECIHFYRNGSGISGTHVRCDFFSELDIASTMIDDHLISSGYRKVFLNLMRDFHKDDHFSFEST